MIQTQVMLMIEQRQNSPQLLGSQWMVSAMWEKVQRDRRECGHGSLQSMGDDISLLFCLFAAQLITICSGLLVHMKCDRVVLAEVLFIRNRCVLQHLCQVSLKFISPWLSRWQVAHWWR